MLNDGTSKHENPEVATCAHFLEAFPQVPPSFANVEELACAKPSSNEEHAPKVELKPFPFSLRYEFLGLNSTYPVIVNADPSASHIDSLLSVLRLH